MTTDAPPPPSSFNDFGGTTALRKVVSLDLLPAPAIHAASLPCPRSQRLFESLASHPFCFETAVRTPLAEQISDQTEEDTVLYLAYGSNLAASTFLGQRGIKPISAINVRVPELELAFNLPGLPYQEPCFANTRYLSPTTPSPSLELLFDDENDDDPTWEKGLIGVVYEVTPTDFAKIIATEGGNTSYKDVLVTCYPLPKGTTTISSIPSGEPFKAHTLYCPPDGPSHIHRPLPDYAQPSHRYLGLITTGAEEHGLPDEYQKYLCRLQAYSITTTKQKFGRVLFIGTWAAPVLFMLGLAKLVGDEKGNAPEWYARAMSTLFRGVWGSYDVVFKKMFGDGERTIKKKMSRKDRDDWNTGLWTEKERLLPA
jgi:hypothetical protein